MEWKRADALAVGDIVQPAAHIVARVARVTAKSDGLIAIHCQTLKSEFLASSPPEKEYPVFDVEEPVSLQFLKSMRSL